MSWITYTHTVSSGTEEVAVSVLAIDIKVIDDAAALLDNVKSNRAGTWKVTNNYPSHHIIFLR